ncbi:MAG: serine protein kinase RIO [Gammaproteobacteria bacterium]|nr:serine protein kinase RIO [Gammaproteobacteria bacterium]MDH3449674.1 serine protein kinase RIO [Gammaproteobacteria bacterium]
MKIPARIKPLVEDGLVDEVIRPLMSGKEADVFIVRCGGEIRCAKVYKEADKRGFKQATQYQEGRKVRNSRRARALEKGSRFGRKEQEQLWQNTEVEALFRLARAGVRVPRPYGCFDGVLLMELICDEEGLEAPRLNDVTMSAVQAMEDHKLMMRYVVRMLCAGLVHGDLSEFNVLVDDDGPVIIDLPQVVNAAANNHAKRLLARDIIKITSYYGLYAPEILKTRYAGEIWALYEAGELHPEVALTGAHDAIELDPDVDAVLEEIKQAMFEQQQRLARLQEQV